MHEHRLLILGCSQRKRPDTQLVPAIQRYDGPSFRVVRRFLREHPAQTLDVYVLSAKLGLLAVCDRIADYDQRMTIELAEALQHDTLARLKRILAARQYRELFITVGRHYAPALLGYEQLVPDDCRIYEASGTIGRRLAELRRWLYGAECRAETVPVVRGAGGVVLRGLGVTVTAGQMRDLALRAQSSPEATRYEAWYVAIEGQRVAPKWLVSQLTGLPVGSFVTSEARRVLAQLGLEVHPL